MHLSSTGGTDGTLGSGPPPSFAFDAGPSGVGALLRARVRGELDDAQLVHAMCLVCDDARRKQLRAEELVIRFKQVWATLPEASELPRGERRDDLLSEVISLGIAEYYRPALGHADGGRSD